MIFLNKEHFMSRNTSVTLGEYFDHFVLERINQGRFQSVSEVVRAGLRTLEQEEIKLDKLREKLQSGEDSPTINDFNGEQFIASMHNKYHK
jgi:antitoxin ParD1/3/4